MRKDRRGASLIFVLMLMAFVFVVGLGVVSIAQYSSGQTSVNISQRQADLTAQSILDAVVAKIKDNTINPATAATNPNAINGSDPQMGGWTYKITDVSSSVGPNCYRISVDAYYPRNSGAHSKMNRIIQQQAGSSFSGIVQTFSTTANNVLTNSNGAYTTGNVAFNSSFTIGNSCVIHGNLDVNGSMNITNGQSTIGPQEDGKSCTVKIKNDFNVGNQITINGDVFVGGNMSVTNGQSVQNGKLYVKGNVDIRNSYTVNGDLYCGGSVLNGADKIKGTIHQHVSNIDSLIQAPVVNVPTTLPTIPDITNTINVNITQDQTISQNGILTFGNNPQWYNGNEGYKITLSAATSDLYITLLTSTNSGQTVTLMPAAADLFTDYNQSSIHNVFLYLSNNKGDKYVNLTVGSGTYLGEKTYYTNHTSTKPPNLYIISNGLSKISMDNSCMLYGYIYAPYGTISMSQNGNPLFGDSKLHGAIAASSVSLINYGYDFIPSSNVQLGGSGSGSAGGGWNTLGTYAGSGS